VTLLKDKLTPIGTITVPVYAHHLRDAPNLARFAFMKIADHLATVTSEDGEREIGTIGGVISAHYEVVLRRDGERTESEATLLLDRSDVWDAVVALYDSPEGQAIVAELRAKSQSAYKAECAARAAEREANERARLEAELARLEKAEGALHENLR
jgi:hypothetical protein